MTARVQLALASCWTKIAAISERASTRARFQKANPIRLQATAGFWRAKQIATQQREMTRRKSALTARTADAGPGVNAFGGQHHIRPQYII